MLQPLNILDGTYRSFEQWVLPVLVKRGMAALAMRTRAGGEILRADIATPAECWRCAAALPVATIVSGMDSMEILRKTLELARALAPMTAVEKKAILDRTRELTLTGQHERFKSSNAFDSPAGRKLYGLS